MHQLNKNSFLFNRDCAMRGSRNFDTSRAAFRLRALTGRYMSPKLRLPVPDDQSARLLFANRHTCCICREPRHEVQEHHIDGDPANNEWDNLAVVCLNCHGRVTGKPGFGRKFSQEEVLTFKRDWESQCAELNARGASATDDADSQEDDNPPAFAENHIGIYVCVISGDLDNTVGERILVEIQQAIGSSRLLQGLRTDLGKSFIAKAINWRPSASTPDQRMRQIDGILQLGHAKAVIWGHWVKGVGQIYCTAGTANETPTTETLSEWGFGQISRWYDSRPRARWLEHTWAFEQKLARLALGSSDIVHPRHERATKAELRSHLGNLIGDRQIIVKTALPYWLLTHRSSHRLLILSTVGIRTICRTGCLWSRRSCRAASRTLIYLRSDTRRGRLASSQRRASRADWRLVWMS